MSGLVAKTEKLARVLVVPQWARALVRCGVAAGVEHAGVLKRLGMLQTIVDVGANRGQFALAARWSCPDARIVAFEPLPEAAAVFRNVFAGDSRVSLVEAAIGPESGEAVIHVSGREDSSSLLPITEAQNEIFPGTAEVGTATVRLARLSEHLGAADIEAAALLKLDVQGYELRALAGCEDLLEHFSWVYAECSFLDLYAGQASADEVIAWLRERGFAVRGVYHMAYDRQGRAVQADFLFERR